MSSYFTSVTLPAVGPLSGAAPSAVSALLPVALLAATLLLRHLRDPEAPPGDAGDRRLLLSRRRRGGYDFIVVGGGSAGAVLANRLSEGGRWTVLLLEAGGQETAMSDVPAAAAYLQGGEMDWGFRAEPQPGRACLGLREGRCRWPRGKVIGGSSVLNYMLYVRGNRRDYDGWEADGNKGWGYRRVLPYFLKSEDNRNPYLTDTKYHSRGGYLTVQEAPWRTPLAAAFVEAGVEMGFENRDANGENQTGFMIPQGTLRRGNRCSAAKAFLSPVRHRRNLHVALESVATKVLIDPQTRVAYGVRFRRKGRTWAMRARKEVVLAAGAINSPQLLMLSGVGPAWHLEEKGVAPLVADLPVGENLMDHYGTGAMVFTVQQPVSLVQTRYETLDSVLRYFLFGTGALTVPGGVEGLAWISTKHAENPGDDYPDVEFHFISGNPGSDAGRSLREVLGLNDDVWRMYRPMTHTDGFSVIPMILRPKSRGAVRLGSKSPRQAPVIYAGYFTDGRDMDVLVDAVKFIVRLSETKPFRSLDATYWETPMPGCEHEQMHTDAYWECMIRHYTVTIYHYSGTAKMGPPGDPGAVVDPRLRVYGVPGLRVVDASAFPRVPSGNTNAPVIMLAERASDLIKEDWAGTRRRTRRRRRKKGAYEGPTKWPEKTAGSSSRGPSDNERRP